MQLVHLCISFGFILISVSSDMCPAGGGEVPVDTENLPDLDGIDWNNLVDQTGMPDEYDDAEGLEESDELLDKPTLREIMIATSGKRFHRLLEEKISAQNLLDHLISSTNVDPQYLNGLFQKALEAEPDSEKFKNKVYSMEKSMHLLNKIVGYVQDDPDDVGRPGIPIEDEITEENREEKLNPNKNEDEQGASAEQYTKDEL